MPDLIEIASIAAKFALYLGIFISFGTFMCLHIFKTQLLALERPLRRFLIAFTCLAVLAALAGFFLQASALTGDISGMVDPEILGILWQTSAGSALTMRLIGLSLLLAGVLIGGIAQWLALLGGVLALWSFAEVGHVSDNKLIWVRVLLVAHLSGVAFWIGILNPLNRLAQNPDTLEIAANLGHRFGQLAAIIVPALMFIGFILAWILVGTIENLTDSTYGQALIIKIAIVGMLLALAAANKLRFIPRMQGGDQTAAHHLITSIRIEWVAMGAILLTTAVFTSVLTLPDP